MTTTDRLTKLRQMHENDPHDADIPYMIAQEFVKAGEHDKAINQYDACLALDANYHYAYFHKARACETLERFDDAIAALRDGLAVAKVDGNTLATNEIGQYLEMMEDDHE